MNWNALKLTRTIIWIGLLLLFFSLAIIKFLSVLNPEYGISYNIEKDSGKFPMFTFCNLPADWADNEDKMSTFEEVIKKLPALNATSIGPIIINSMTGFETLKANYCTVEEIATCADIQI